MKDEIESWKYKEIVEKIQEIKNKIDKDFLKEDTEFKGS